MTIRRSAIITALAVASAIFIVLINATRVSVLIALLIAFAAGGAVLAAARSSSSAPPIVTAPPVPVMPNPPPQYQAQPIAGVPLPSAREGYTFTFSATVYWLPAVDSVTEPGAIAAGEIVRRAREITQRRNPAEALFVNHELASLLADAQPDPTGRVHVRAESVQLHLSADDQRRLEELARLRKEEELWDYQRRSEQSKRRYLGEDVLRDAGSAVVWWLARNDDQPVKVAESIGVLTQLAHAANNADGDPLGNAARAEHRAPTAALGSPRASAEVFGTFIDSLDSLGDDARLMLTMQMASLVESHGYPVVAREMTVAYDGRAADSASDVADDQPEPRDL